MLGAPGGTYWAGGAYSAPLHGAWMVNSEAVPDFRVMAAGPKEKRDNNSFEFDNGLFGYALAYFTVDLKDRGIHIQGVAVSGIKTKALGEVVLSSMSLARNEASINYFKNNSVVRGSQLSEAFGYALACGDVNGDGLPEIFIGAPFYFSNLTDSDDSSRKNYDSGRVYVYQTMVIDSNVYAEYGPPHNLVFNEAAPVVTLDGVDSQARFGSAVEFLGDINDDGFGDIAISAPFGGPKRLGTVYIFLGSKEGFTSGMKPSQIIEASELPQPLSAPTKLTSTMFGHTLQGGYDVDGNEYPDLVVGAIGSDSVVVLRSRPVAKLTSSVAISPRIIGHTPATRCKDDPNGNGTYFCADFLYCFDYSGKSLPTRLEVAMTVDADILLTNAPSAPTGRAFFEGDQSSFFKKITLKLTDRSCGQERVRILKSPSDLLTPIVFQVTLATLPPPENSKDLVPIFSTGETFVVNATSDIAKDCGDDNICIPDLKIDLDKTLMKTAVIGDMTPVLVNLTVTNFGEEAYGGQVMVTAPKGALFNGREVFEVLKDGSLQRLSLQEFVCSIKAQEEAKKDKTNDAVYTIEGINKPNVGKASSYQTVICDLPQPFRYARKVEMRLSFSMGKVESEQGKDVAVFNASVSSKNPEKNATLWNNRALVNIQMKPDLSIDVDL